MRMMLRFTLPVERGNAAVGDGMIAKTVESIMSQLKPEAAYSGRRPANAGGWSFSISPTRRRSWRWSSRFSLISTPRPSWSPS
jgi:hypothetical protein